MEDYENADAVTLRHEPWNKGKLIGQKPPLRPKHVWSIRTKLQFDQRTRDLAMFNLALDSKLRGCDLVALKVAQRVCHRPRQYPPAEDRSARPVRVDAGHAASVGRVSGRERPRTR